MIPGPPAHLWQSNLFAGAAWLHLWCCEKIRRKCATGSGSSRLQSFSFRFP